jgi:ribosome-associated protein
VIVVRGYVVPDSELSWRFSRSSGPGGQSVNTSDSRVELIFDLAGSDALPETLKQRALARVGDQVVIIASEHRSQLRNRRAAEDRLAELLVEATRAPPKPRVPTKPTKASKQRRLDSKKKRGRTKQLRGRPPLGG